MELALIRSLMDKDFYIDNRSRCPDELFSADVRKIKRTIDKAIEQYNRNVTPSEVEALFMAHNPTLTTAQKQGYSALFKQINEQDKMGSDITQEVLSNLFRKVVGEKVANIGFQYVNGDQISLEPLHNIIQNYAEDFTPKMNIEWEDTDLHTLLERNDLEAKWSFNIPTLARKISGISDGHLIEIGARPNCGKTSFHASVIASENGFAAQGAKCVILCNEESAHRVGARYLTAATGMSLQQIKQNPAEANKRYQPIRDKIFIKDSTGRDMNWVEGLVKSYKPDIVVLDMGDKFARTGGFARPDEALRNCASHARMIAKEYGCAVLYMSQLSAEAEGKILLNQSMMEGSRTGKAAEADLMLLLARNPVVDNKEEDDPERHINIAKNKLSGWHGVVHCKLDYLTARYTA